jgi:hypothetical protein
MLPKIVVYLTIATARGTSVHNNRTQFSQYWVEMSVIVVGRLNWNVSEPAKSGPFLAFQEYVMPRSVTKCLSLAFLEALGEL